VKKLLLATAVAFCWGLPANATTWDLSTLNITGLSGRTHVCPCKDPITGVTIVGSSYGEQNGWTIGTDTLYFQGGSRGNNASKLYVPGGQTFPLPTMGSETMLGQNNQLYTGDFAQSNGFPLYFWFGASATSSVGVAEFLNGFDIAGGSGNVTVTGYSDLGITPIPGDTMTVTLPGNAVLPLSLGWSGVEQISITGGSGFYVNDIEVNDAVAPAPLIGHGLLIALAIGGILFGSRLLERRKRRRSLGIVTPHAVV
jgi:hypothetical protein